MGDRGRVELLLCNLSLVFLPSLPEPPDNSQIRLGRVK